MSFDAPTGDPSALAEPPDYHGCVKTRATIRKKDIANDRRGHHSSAGSSRRDGDGPLRLTSAHSAPARTRTGLPRGLPATNGKTRQFLIVHTACDFCRSSNKSCQQPQLSRIRCGNCSRHHKRCTWGGLNLEGELYRTPSVNTARSAYLDTITSQTLLVDKSESRGLVARFNGVGFGIVRHASHDWPAAFEAVELAIAFLNANGVTPLDAPTLAAKTEDCYNPGACPTEWPPAARDLLERQFGPRFGRLPVRVSITQTSTGQEPDDRVVRRTGADLNAAEDVERHRARTTAPSSPETRGKRPPPVAEATEPAFAPATGPTDDPDARRPPKRPRKTPFLDLKAISAARERGPAATLSGALAPRHKAASPAPGTTPSAQPPARPRLRVADPAKPAPPSTKRTEASSKARAPSPPKAERRVPETRTAAADRPSARHRLGLINAQLAALEKERQEVKAELADDEGLRAALRGR